MIEPRLLKHEMHMRRPIRVTMQEFQQLPHGSIMWNRVGNGSNRIKPEDAILITAHNTASIRTLSVRVLHIIVAG